MREQREIVTPDIALTREDELIGKCFSVGIVIASILMVANLPSRAEDDPAALAKALSQASVPLEQGLTASEREGKPISAKFEIGDDGLQLSVYTAKGDGFKEVIVDHKSGSIKEAEAITKDDDLKDAKEQNDAMAKATSALAAAVSRAVQANSGYRAASIFPTLEGGHPTATITLMKGDDVKKVTEKLD